MRVAFTGTREGMTELQKAAVRQLLIDLCPECVHHGDCTGSDDEFADICATLVPRPWIVAHPGESARGGVNDLFRAFNANNDEVLSVRPFLSRNRELVRVLREPGDTLIATPKQMERQTSGGTWFTIGQAESQGKRRIIVYPDGTCEELI